MEPRPSDVLSECSKFIFRFVCACLGLEAGFPAISYLGLLFWSIAAATCPIMAALFAHYRTTSDELSFLDVTSAAQGIIFVLTTFAFVYACIVHRSKVERVVQTEVVNASDVLIVILGSLPMFALCYSVLRRARETMIIVGYTNVIIFHFGTTAFFVIHTNASRGLLVQLERLHEQTRRSRLSWNYLMREKLRIRRQIRAVNFVFSSCLGFHYIGLFVATILTLGYVMGRGMRMHEKSVLLMNLLTYVATLLRTARQSSRIILQCLETEFHVWRLFVNRVDLPGDEKQSNAVDFFRFREEWDTLQVACFSANSANFAKYLCTVVTCVAVVLQFDFKVQRVLRNLAETPVRT